MQRRDLIDTVEVASMPRAAGRLIRTHSAVMASIAEVGAGATLLGDGSARTLLCTPLAAGRAAIATPQAVEALAVLPHLDCAVF